MSMEKGRPTFDKACVDELADSSHLPGAFRADKYQCFWHFYVCHELVQPRYCNV